jgi:hypothetical protein
MGHCANNCPVILSDNIIQCVRIFAPHEQLRTFLSLPRAVIRYNDTNLCSRPKNCYASTILHNSVDVNTLISSLSQCQAGPRSCRGKLAWVSKAGSTETMPCRARVGVQVVGSLHQALVVGELPGCRMAESVVVGKAGHQTAGAVVGPQWFPGGQRAPEGHPHLCSQVLNLF